MPQDLIGKRVLVQAPPFFGYDRTIADALRERGAAVDLIPDRPFASALMHGIIKVERRAVLKRATRIYRQMLEKLDSPRYDHVLVVNGQTMSEDFLKELRTNYPNAKFSYYIWDAFENRPYAVKMLSLYDSAFSFDRIAADKYNVGYRPLFFAPEFEQPYNPDADIDLSFIGSAHSDRPAIVHHIDKHLSSSVSRYWFLYLKAPWVLHYNRLTNSYFRGLPSSLFSYEPLSRDGVKSIFARSRAILDIEHELQTGMTIRTFESIGSRKKLITTNSTIKEADFFHEDNIRVIDRKDPVIDQDFLNSPTRELSLETRHRYTAQGWVNDVVV